MFFQVDVFLWMPVTGKGVLGFPKVSCVTNSLKAHTCFSLFSIKMFCRTNRLNGRWDQKLQCCIKASSSWWFCVLLIIGLGLLIYGLHCCSSASFYLNDSLSQWLLLGLFHVILLLFILKLYILLVLVIFCSYVSFALMGLWRPQNPLMKWSCIIYSVLF